MNSLFKTVTHSNNERKVVPFQNHQDIEHKILIERLELSMFIGVLPEEKKAKQRVIIDLEISIEPKCNYKDSIDNTVSYASIIQDIEKLTASKHFNLVETLAEEISTICLTHSTAQEVQITVKKPDIITNAKAVGFSMTRVKAK